MNQEPILQYESTRKQKIFHPNNYLQSILLFAAGAIIAIITNIIGNGTYTAGEISYATLSLNLSEFNDLSVISAFLSILKQNLIDLAAVCLTLPVCITIFSRSLISLLLILKGFCFGRYIGVLLYLCSRSTDLETISHPIISFVVSFSAAVLCNILLLYLCVRAQSFSNNIVNSKEKSEVSLLLSSDTSSFLITFLTILGTVLIISIFKFILLWLVSLI